MHQAYSCCAAVLGKQKLSRLKRVIIGHANPYYRPTSVHSRRRRAPASLAVSLCWELDAISDARPLIHRLSFHHVPLVYYQQWRSSSSSAAAAAAAASVLQCGICPQRSKALFTDTGWTEWRGVPPKLKCGARGWSISDQYAWAGVVALFAIPATNF